MCISLEATVVEVREKTAIVDIGGTQQEVRTPYVEVKVGDKVKCFGNYVIEKLI
ncbi:MAG: HypC/HybG/HupF family hydrogenase formation chaperone [archaeon]